MKKASLLVIVYFVWLSETQVDAYLDPGSGSMLLQILLGGIAGVAVAGKMYWQRIKARFSGGSKKPE